LRDKNYVFALENWSEIKEIYETLPNETKLSSRNWELWHPILSLAAFINKPLYNEMFSFAEEQAEQKQIENMTETAEYVIVQSLLDMVEDKTSFYPVKDIQTTMVEQLGEENWLNNKWIGRAMGRLGFLDKRRVGTGIEYQLSVSKVKELAQRLGILNDFTSTQTTQTTQTTLPNPESSVVNVVSEVNVVANSRGDDDIYDPESEDDKE